MLRYDRKVRSAPSGISAQFERNLHPTQIPLPHAILADDHLLCLKEMEDVPLD